MEAVRRLRDVIILTAFMLSIFALVGLQLYSGKLLHQCKKNNSTTSFLYCEFSEFFIFSQCSVYYLMFIDWWKENSTELHEQACCISSVFYCVISQLRSNQYWSESTLLKYEACALTKSALLWIYDNFKQ